MSIERIIRMQTFGKEVGFQKLEGKGISHRRAMHMASANPSRRLRVRSRVTI